MTNRKLSFLRSRSDINKKVRMLHKKPRDIVTLATILRFQSEVMLEFEQQEKGRNAHLTKQLASKRHSSQLSRSTDSTASSPKWRKSIPLSFYAPREIR
jgi:hypothetical protein